MEIAIYGGLSMNTYKKLVLATLIVGVSSQAINAHPWSPKSIAAVTLAGLGIGAAGAVKYYGLNNLTIATLEKCAKIASWTADLAYNKIPNTIKNALFGSYIKQINDQKDAQVKELQKRLEIKKKLKTKLAKKEAELAAKESDRKDAHERAISLTKQIITKNETLKQLMAEQARIETIMRGTIAGISGRSGTLEVEKRAVITQNSKLQDELAAQAQTIANLQEKIAQLHAQIAQLSPEVPSDEATSESSIAPTDIEESKSTDAEKAIEAEFELV